VSEARVELGHEHEPATPWRICLACGEEIELILWVLGSVRCMDCRIDAQQSPLPTRALRRPRSAA
jgi:hypothetical protein